MEPKNNAKFTNFKCCHWEAAVCFILYWMCVFVFSLPVYYDITVSIQLLYDYVYMCVGGVSACNHNWMW